MQTLLCITLPPGHKDAAVEVMTFSRRRVSSALGGGDAAAKEAAAECGIDLGLPRFTHTDNTIATAVGDQELQIHNNNNSASASRRGSSLRGPHTAGASDKKSSFLTGGQQRLLRGSTTSTLAGIGGNADGGGAGGGSTSGSPNLTSLLTRKTSLNMMIVGENNETIEDELTMDDMNREWRRQHKKSHKKSGGGGASSVASSSTAVGGGFNKNQQKSDKTQRVVMRNGVPMRACDVEDDEDDEIETVSGSGTDSGSDAASSSADDSSSDDGSRSNESGGTDRPSGTHGGGGGRNPNNQKYGRDLTRLMKKGNRENKKRMSSSLGDSRRRRSSVASSVAAGGHYDSDNNRSISPTNSTSSLAAQQMAQLNPYIVNDEPKLHVDRSIGALGVYNSDGSAAALSSSNGKGKSNGGGSHNNNNNKKFAGNRNASNVSSSDGGAAAGPSSPTSSSQTAAKHKKRFLEDVPQKIYYHQILDAFSKQDMIARAARVGDRIAHDGSAMPPTANSVAIAERVVTIASGGGAISNNSASSPLLSRTGGVENNSSSSAVKAATAATDALQKPPKSIIAAKTKFLALRSSSISSGRGGALPSSSSPSSSSGKKGGARNSATSAAAAAAMGSGQDVSVSGVALAESINWVASTKAESEAMALALLEERRRKLDALRRDEHRRGWHGKPESTEEDDTGDFLFGGSGSRNFSNSMTNASASGAAASAASLSPSPSGTQQQQPPTVTINHHLPLLGEWPRCQRAFNAWVTGTSVIRHECVVDDVITPTAPEGEEDYTNNNRAFDGSLDEFAGGAATSRYIVGADGSLEEEAKGGGGGGGSFSPLPTARPADSARGSSHHRPNLMGVNSSNCPTSKLNLDQLRNNNDDVSAMAAAAAPVVEPRESFYAALSSTVLDGLWEADTRTVLMHGADHLEHPSARLLKRNGLVHAIIKDIVAEATSRFIDKHYRVELILSAALIDDGEGTVFDLGPVCAVGGHKIKLVTKSQDDDDEGKQNNNPLGNSGNNRFASNPASGPSSARGTNHNNNYNGSRSNTPSPTPQNSSSAAANSPSAASNNGAATGGVGGGNGGGSSLTTSPNSSSKFFSSLRRNKHDDMMEDDGGQFAFRVPLNFSDTATAGAIPFSVRDDMANASMRAAEDALYQSHLQFLKAKAERDLKAAEGGLPPKRRTRKTIAAEKRMELLLQHRRETEEAIKKKLPPPPPLVFPPTLCHKNDELEEEIDLLPQLPVLTNNLKNYTVAAAPSALVDIQAAGDKFIDSVTNRVARLRTTILRSELSSSFDTENWLSFVEGQWHAHTASAGGATPRPASEKQNSRNSHSELSQPNNGSGSGNGNYPQNNSSSTMRGAGRPQQQKVLSSSLLKRSGGGGAAADANHASNNTDSPQHSPTASSRPKKHTADPRRSALQVQIQIIKHSSAQSGPQLSTVRFISIADNADAVANILSAVHTKQLPRSCGDFAHAVWRLMPSCPTRLDITRRLIFVQSTPLRDLMKCLPLMAAAKASSVVAHLDGATPDVIAAADEFLAKKASQETENAEIRRKIESSEIKIKQIQRKITSNEATIAKHHQTVRGSLGGPNSLYSVAGTPAPSVGGFTLGGGGGENSGGFWGPQDNGSLSRRTSLGGISLSEMGPNGLSGLGQNTSYFNGSFSPNSAPAVLDAARRGGGLRGRLVGFNDGGGGGADSDFGGGSPPLLSHLSRMGSKFGGGGFGGGGTSNAGGGSVKGQLTRQQQNDLLMKEIDVSRITTADIFNYSSTFATAPAALNGTSDNKNEGAGDATDSNATTETSNSGGGGGGLTSAPSVMGASKAAMINALRNANNGGGNGGIGGAASVAGGSISPSTGHNDWGEIQRLKLIEREFEFAIEKLKYDLINYSKETGTEINKLKNERNQLSQRLISLSAQRRDTRREVAQRHVSSQIAVDRILETANRISSQNRVVINELLKPPGVPRLAFNPDGSVNHNPHKQVSSMRATVSSAKKKTTATAGAHQSTAPDASSSVASHLNTVNNNISSNNGSLPNVSAIPLSSGDTAKGRAPSTAAAGGNSRPSTATAGRNASSSSTPSSPPPKATGSIFGLSQIGLNAAEQDQVDGDYIAPYLRAHADALREYEARMKVAELDRLTAVADHKDALERRQVIENFRDSLKLAVKQYAMALQLYGVEFPYMYRWILEREAGRNAVSITSDVQAPMSFNDAIVMNTK